MNSKWLYWLVSFGGVGSIPKAPGTFGTLAAIPLWILLQNLHPYSYMILVLVLVLASVFICELYERAKGTHDSSEIVLDEVVGFLVAMTWVPLDVRWVVLGFVVFRLLDIFKPGPIGTIDRKLKGGAGVVFDDVFAGMVTNIVLQVSLTFI